MKRLWGKGMNRAIIAISDLDCLALVRDICDGLPESKGLPDIEHRAGRPVSQCLSDPGEGASQLAAELMPSFVYTLRRCHSTVRGLMNSWAPISGFVRPSPAAHAICASWAVISSRVSTVRLRTVSPVTSSSRRARSAKAWIPMALSMS